MVQTFRISARTHASVSVDAGYADKLTDLRNRLREKNIRIVGFEGRAQPNVLIQMDDNDLRMLERSLPTTWQVKACRFPIPQ